MTNRSELRQGSQVPACGTTAQEHRAATCRVCKAVYASRRKTARAARHRAEIENGAREKKKPRCGSHDPAHRRRECRRCKQLYDKACWPTRSTRRAKRRAARPLSIAEQDDAANRLRARVRSRIRRSGQPVGPCTFCESTDVRLLIEDADAGEQWLWSCDAHVPAASRALALRVRDIVEEKAETGVAPPLPSDERARILAAIAALSSPEREALEEEASRGPVGIRLSPEAPLYAMQLVRAFARRYEPNK